MRVPRLIFTLLTVGILAACGGGTSPSAQPSTSSQAPSVEPSTASAEPSTVADFGPPEQTELTIGFRFPNATFYLPQLIAMNQGYFAEEGLTIKDLVTASDLGAALAGNSIDIAMEWPEAPYQAANAGLPETIISGYLCRTRQAFAVQPDVQSVADLDGKAVTLAGVSGDLQAVARKNVLAANGWDLDTVNVEIVYPGGGSDVWRQFFVNGQIALMPYFVDDEEPLRAYGANFILDVVVPAPRGVLIARPDWVQQNPNTVGRYLRAIMKAHEYLLSPGIGQEPEHRDDMLAMLADAGFTDPMPAGPWAFDENNMCPNLHIGDTTWDYLLQLYELDPKPLSEVSDLSALYKAQELLGLDNSPAVEIAWPPN